MNTNCVQLIITPGINVTFDLTQLLGGHLTTHYIWRFGDGSPVVDAEGYASGHSQVHMFQNPGTYSVNVTARNNGGTSQTVTVISVLGEDHLSQRTVGNDAPHLTIVHLSSPLSTHPHLHIHTHTSTHTHTTHTHVHAPYHRSNNQSGNCLARAVPKWQRTRGHRPAVQLPGDHSLWHQQHWSYPLQLGF